ncbi:UPF0104 family protein [uncultured Methanobrevibacter sp.]|uniref:UPF0104 family protein n=1 Tax=uncultured Methanobrevibacter sp. TaxID=253161 RepID=UPI0025CF634B|nr:UPF0104 family protein [uncultured Methanobrevibacter sp.]
MDKRSAFFIVFSIVILIVMVYFVGIDNLIETLKDADLNLVALAVVMQIFTYFLYTLRWKILNNLADINVGFRKLLPIMMVGLAVNNITPSGRGGGEPVRAYILAKEHGYELKNTFATVVADRMLDTFPFIVLAIITIVSMILYFDIAQWLVVVLVLSVIVISAILLILIYMCINLNFGRRVEGWIVGVVRRFSKKDSSDLENNVHENIFGFQKTMKLLISDKNVLYTSIPLSFLIWIMEIMRVYVVFLAFGATLNVIVIGEVFILASLVGMIPLLPGGLGAVDGLMIGFYSKAGVAYSLAAPVTLIERAISFWLATIIGLIILPYYGSSVLDKLSLGKASEDLKNSEEK